MKSESQLLRIMPSLAFTMKRATLSTHLSTLANSKSRSRIIDGWVQELGKNGHAKSPFRNRSRLRVYVGTYLRKKSSKFAVTVMTVTDGRERAAT